jgi:ribonuclease D
MTDRSPDSAPADEHGRLRAAPGRPLPEPATDLLVIHVDEVHQVEPALEQVASAVVGVDVERADADNYYRRAALIQVGVAGHCVLLDGVSLDELPELDRFLDGDRLAVLHAVENDLEPLAAKGVHPDRVADTAVAASMLGLPTGLGTLLREVLGVELTADKESFQRADWAERPLSDGMAAYAAGDVVHLPALWSSLEHQLDDAGRKHWYEQELAWIIERADEDTRDWTRVKGAARLTGAQRAVLRAVWDERERLAKQHDLAPNRLVHDDVLRDLAVDPPRTEAQLVRRSQRRRSLLRKHAADLLDAVERGLAAEPEEKDNGGRRWTDRDKATFDALRRARADVAEGLDLDAGVLCPSRPLWRAVAAEPTDPAALCAAVELRPWQTELLADALWEAYTKASTPSPNGDATLAAGAGAGTDVPDAGADAPDASARVRRESDARASDEATSAGASDASASAGQRADTDGPAEPGS